MNDVLVSISVVSHRQGALVALLLGDLNLCCRTPIEVVVTVNVDECLPFTASDFKFPVTITVNNSSKGFGANHNAAFQRSKGDVFCVSNPDIRLQVDPFPGLLRCLRQSTGAVGPLVVNSQGAAEESARPFPTPLRVLAKAMVSSKHIQRTERRAGDPDWVAGMFMVFRSQTFRDIQGFDERYFLYYEDVDLCARLRLAGYDVRQCQSARVIHEAQRQSHRELRYFKWHFLSMLRFFTSSVFIRIFWRRMRNARRSK